MPHRPTLRHVLTERGVKMKKKPRLTTEAGAPVADNQHSQTAGPGGPVLLQDHYLIEKLARFNRERIPERIVHAVGTGAHGYFEVTNPDVPKWTRMRVFSTVGKRKEEKTLIRVHFGTKGFVTSKYPCAPVPTAWTM